jgi:hypothetical protein
MLLCCPSANDISRSIVSGYANTGSVTEREISSSLRELDREDLSNIVAMKSVKQELSDAVRIVGKAAEGSARAGGLMKQDGKLNIVILIASGDRLTEVMLEPPKVGRDRPAATSRANSRYDTLLSAGSQYRCRRRSSRQGRAPHELKL